jgi:hypothetical protein
MGSLANRTMAAINDVEAMQIPAIPPLLQREFAQRVTEVCELETQLVASRERLDDLFRSMLYEAFNGER